MSMFIYEDEDLPKKRDIVEEYGKLTPANKEAVDLYIEFLFWKQHKDDGETEKLFDEMAKEGVFVPVIPSKELIEELEAELEQDEMINDPEDLAALI